MLTLRVPGSAGRAGRDPSMLGLSGALPASDGEGRCLRERLVRLLAMVP